MPKLIVAILTNLQTCHDVIHLWEELGVPGATILDSIGMRHLKERHARCFCGKPLETTDTHYGTIRAQISKGRVPCEPSIGI